MMNPKAMEALRKARELFAEKADDIPANATPVEPIRKPRVVLLPTNAPKFTKETMKQEHKQEKNGHSFAQTELEKTLEPMGLTTHSMRERKKQIDVYVEMSTRQATQVCIDKGITKPADIAKETGKNVNQIYTAMWHIKKAKRKAKLKQIPVTKQQAKKVMYKLADDDFDREPTPFEDAHYVVLKSREEYEKEIDRVCEQRNALEKENAELKAVIKYLERKVMV